MVGQFLSWSFVLIVPVLWFMGARILTNKHKTARKAVMFVWLAITVAGIYAMILAPEWLVDAKTLLIKLAVFVGVSILLAMLFDKRVKSQNEDQ